MTVTYSRDVASASFLCLYKLLFKWKGSIWKSVWAELLLWLVVYANLSVTYRIFLDEHQREIFEDISIFCDTYANFIPITFMLGFYVSAIFGRWQKIFDNIGWIDTPGLTVAAHIEGTTEIARNIRRNVVRHMVLMQALVFRDISMRVRKRFPTLNHLVTAGFMTPEELRHYNKVASQHEKFWQPMQWIFSSTRTARQMGLIASDIAYTDLNLKISQFRANVISLTFFDWVQIPLAYTQVVHLAVRSFFVLAVMGRQLLHPFRDIPGFKNQPLDVYYPVMSTLQLTFLIGWMKVAEVMINPLGEDDDDFETNWILDRNLQVGLSMADDQFDKFPPIERDAFWEDVNVEPFYTPEAAAIPRNPQIGSCANIQPHIENSFMLRLRKRTISENTYRTENDDTDVVPVAGLDINRELQRSSSPLLNTTRRLSALVKQMRAKGRGRLDTRRPTIVPSSNETEDTCDGRSSPEGSVDLTEVVTVPMRNMDAKPKRRVRVLSVQELSEITEERLSNRSSRAHLEHSQTDSAIYEQTESDNSPRIKRPRSQ